MDEDIFEFAMVISVAREQEATWERALRSARPEPGIRMTVRSGALVLFVVTSIQEFLAIEKAQQYLEQIARSAGVRVALNAQPSHEV